MLIYIYGKCSTCKDAVKFLENQKIEFEVKEITKETPSLAELERMFEYQNKNIRKIFNTSGLLYKEMELKEKLTLFSLEEALALLHQHAMLIKRPFFITEKFGLTGFKETEWREVLKSV